jgi:hypothetical protein
MTATATKVPQLRPREAWPSLKYHPGREEDLDEKPVDEADNGQYQLHAAKHVFRICAPGNGWGKTTTAAVELDWWARAQHPYQDTPQRSIVALWVCQKFQQFEVMKPKLEAWWPPSVGLSWHGQHHRYLWPNGSACFIFTSESSWETLQGVEPDLVLIDEECDAGLWRELVRRRRPPVETRFLITATATQGLTWTYRDLYLPWLQFHAKLGMDEQQARRVS